MGMIKKGASAVAETPVAPRANPATDSGTAAAVSRLKKKSETVAVIEEKAAAIAPSVAKFVARDYDKEARGKTRCVQFEAALQSPAIAGMKFESFDEYLEMCRKAADFGTDYTFDELPAKK